MAFALIQNLNVGKPKYEFYRLGLLILLSAGCQPLAKKNKYDPSKVDLTPVDGGLYVEASSAEPSFLNPLLATDSASSDINSQVFNGLVKYDKDLKLVGELATDWTIVNGGKTITFHLRNGVTWHDGKPFTSADVMYTYRMLVSSTTRTPYGADYLLVKKAEAPDPLTFRVTYAEPFAPALESWGIGVIPKHVFEGTDINTNPANRRPIGTGPYLFDRWVTEEKVELKPNPHYYEGRPHFDRFICRIIPDPAVRFLELRNESLSILSPTPDQYNGYDEFFVAYNKYHYPAFQYDYVGFNLKNGLFKNKKIRQAIAYAINKDLIIEGVYQGHGVPVTGPFPPQSWAYNHDVEGFPYNPEKARRMLADEGWTDTDGDGIVDKNGKPFEFTLTTNHGNDVRKYIAQLIQNDLKQVGINMDVRIIEWSVFIHRYIDNREFDAVLLGWNLSRDPDGYSIWHSSQMEGKKYNFVSYRNPEVDRLLEKGRRTFGVENRRPIYHRIHELIADDVPYVFLVTPESLPVVHKKIQGVKLAPAGIGWNFVDWYIPKPWQTQAHFSS